MFTHSCNNPFFQLGLEKAQTLSTDRLRREYCEAKAELDSSPSADGRAYVDGLHEALVLTSCEKVG